MMCSNENGVLCFQRVSHSYAVPGKTPGDAVRPVLHDISLHIRKGEIFCIVGPSGCGKSTLLNLAAGLQVPSSGQVYAHGKPVTEPGTDRAVMFQNDTLFPWLSVRHNIAFGPACRRNDQRLREVDEMVRLVGLGGFEEYLPAALSGGMRQRVALARALITHADILLLDEPFASLDAQTREAMQELLLSIHQRFRPTILLVTHDIEEAAFLGDRAAVLRPQPQGSEFCTMLDIDLPRPRTALMRENTRLVELRQSLRTTIRSVSNNAGTIL